MKTDKQRHGHITRETLETLANVELHACTLAQGSTLSHKL